MAGKQTDPFDVAVVFYEVHLLGKDGWEVHARYPSEEQPTALGEAKALEAQLAAATKVVRSEYHPRSGAEDRRDIYVSRLAPEEPAPPPASVARMARLRANAAAGGRAPREAPVIYDLTRPERKKVHRDMSAVAVLLRLMGILGSSAFLAMLVTVFCGVAIGYLPGLKALGIQASRVLLFGIFMTAFLLVALPWIISYARQIESIRFSGPRLPQPRPRRARPAAPAATAAGAAEPVPEPPTVPARETLDLDAFEADADETGAPMATDQVPDIDAVPAPEPAEHEDLEAANESRKTYDKARATLIRFLRRLVEDLREARPDLNSFDHYGLGLLLAGAVDRMVEHAGVGPVGRAKLLREALSVLGRQPGLIEAVEEDLDITLADARSARMMASGGDAMRLFLGGSRDFLAAVLGALEAWSRPSGATGGGVVAAVVIQAWPNEEDARDLAYQVAQERGGAVIGAMDGIAMLFPGVARAVRAAVDMLPELPAASRIGVEASEAANEEAAVRSVGAARALCHAARPGQILCSAAVKALAGDTAAFEQVPGEAGGMPVFLALAAIDGGPQEGAEPQQPPEVAPTA